MLQRDRSHYTFNTLYSTQDTVNIRFYVIGSFLWWRCENRAGVRNREWQKKKALAKIIMKHTDIGTRLQTYSS